MPSKQEKIRLTERVKAGLEKAKSKGRIGGRPRILQESINRIQLLNRQGLSMRKIGKEINVHHRTVAQYLNV
jgi:DNA invertase Pin-like site-specific DNA recombinase